MGKFIVFVDDNFHFMNEDERYQSGTFDTYEEAVAKAREVVDRFLIEQYDGKITAEELYKRWAHNGESPFISGDFSTEHEEEFAAHCKSIVEELGERAQAGGDFLAVMSKPINLPSLKIFFSASQYARERCEELCAIEDFIKFKEERNRLSDEKERLRIMDLEKAKQEIAENLKRLEQVGEIRKTLTPAKFEIQDWQFGTLQSNDGTQWHSNTVEWSFGEKVEVYFVTVIDADNKLPDRTRNFFNSLLKLENEFFKHVAALGIIKAFNSIFADDEEKPDRWPFSAKSFRSSCVSVLWLTIDPEGESELRYATDGGPMLCIFISPDLKVSEAYLD